MQGEDLLALLRAEGRYAVGRGMVPAARLLLVLAAAGFAFGAVMGSFCLDDDTAVTGCCGTASGAGLGLELFCFSALSLFFFVRPKIFRLGLVPSGLAASLFFFFPFAFFAFLPAPLPVDVLELSASEAVNFPDLDMESTGLP